MDKVGLHELTKYIVTVVGLSMSELKYAKQISVA